ncbi:ABC transporter substrate-binding protein [Enterocloster clostridioformis]|uniref:ABC transporter substrate-binding protein n=1 Tax=Enterocloster clostridioformis TaxID=1531 RepID=UPI0018AA0B3B|nr:ABC transporter substrate-binding protein [Enterocloster clostridioformis]MDB2127182.1 ABC transporter substrate-binding protein [Enterocloster clostridioformis]MDU1960535.1 ABC transporter substrate-binding protein [Enterocloster clostridioformis]
MKETVMGMKADVRSMKAASRGMKAAVRSIKAAAAGPGRAAGGKRKFTFSILCLFCTAVLSSCQSGPETAPMPAVPDLVLYTAQEEEIYEPIIKEFEERTNLMVKVERGSSEEMTGRLEYEEERPDWDVVFGVGIETLEQSKEHWQVFKSPEAAFITESFQCEDNRWTSFSALPLVIMYNTNVVTYRELPVGWNSLLEPRWKGRIAFVDPRRSDVYSAALVTAVHTWEKRGDYLEQFMENLEYGTLNSMQEVNAGILDGRYSLGVTMEESAQALLSEGADVDYIYPQEGTTALPDGTAIVKGCSNPDAARQFLDFTVSRDTQRILVSDLNRRSVRSDVPPLPGLSPIGRLPLIEMDLEELTREKKDVLARWNGILSRREGRPVE